MRLSAPVVNREQMLEKLMKTAASADRDLTFEIGSNSDFDFREHNYGKPAVDD